LPPVLCVNSIKIVIRDKNNSMKTLITGGAGFIGSHLADLLIELNFE
jgi:hypothetical protein